MNEVLRPSQEREQAGPQKGDTGWLLSHMEPDPETVRGCVSGPRLVSYAQLLTNGERSLVGPTNVCWEKGEGWGCRPQKAHQAPIPCDSNTYHGQAKARVTS